MTNAQISYTMVAVSYTHLDVYKRQSFTRGNMAILRSIPAKGIQLQRGSVFPSAVSESAPSAANTWSGLNKMCIRDRNIGG